MSGFTYMGDFRILLVLSYVTIAFSLFGTTIRLISWIVRGLNSKVKHTLMFEYLAPHTPHVILLQETHLQGSGVLSLKRAKIAYAIHSTYARGTSILIAKFAQISLKHIKTDPIGCLLSLSLKFWVNHIL